MNTTPELIIDRARRSPNALALICGAQAWTYAQLAAEASRVAHRLRILGVQRGDTVAVLLERSPELVVALLGSWLAGAAFIPVDSETPPERFALILEDAKPAALITSARLAVRVTTPPRALLVLDREAETLAGYPSDPPAIEIGADDAAYLIYTSGSTGRPKGAINWHRSVLNLYRWFSGEFGMDAHTRSLIISSIGFDQTHKAIWGPLIAGGTIVLLETPYYDPVLIRETAQRQAATFISCTPSALYGLIEEAGEAEFAQLASLEQVFPIGEALRYERLRAWVANPRNRAQVVNTYGPTECADVLTWYVAHDFSVDGVVPLGRALPGVRLCLLNADGQIAAEGERGELCAAGVCVGGGYLNLPEQTARAFIDHAFAGDGKLYRTGDLASRDADGVYHYHGRLDHQVKIRGHRIELQEVESVLGRHPAVTEAACTACDDGRGNNFLAAYLRLRPGESADIAGLRQHLRRTLPDYMTPSTFTFVEAMPLNPSGKLDRKALPKPALARPPVSTPFVAPAGPLEAQLAALWAEILGFGELGAEDRFFELGGSSIQAIQFVGRLSRALDIRVPIAQFFSTPTIRGLGRWLVSTHVETTARWLGVGPKTLEIQKAEKRQSARAGAHGGDVAVIGMAARLPGADDIEAFWKLLVEGREGLHRLSDEELDAAGVTAERRAAPNYIRVGGYLSAADCFDAAFFGIPAREAALIDPQQRVFLEVAWNAVEHAGIDVQRNDRPIGVFAGVARNAYLMHNVASHPDLRENAGDFYTLLGNDKDYLATRVAFKLNLKGPAFTVQTACSSSGVALHLALQSLRAGECDAALVGGGRIISPMQAGYTHIDGGPLSADGQIRAFDAQASGMVRTSGIACVVLKRLQDALADGDTVYAVVKGSAINNDGSSKAAFTAPSVDGQAEVIAQALVNAQVAADTVRYIEAHGTATLLGDPIEMAALNRVYGGPEASPRHIAIGSVKSNIGHIDAGAAMAGLIKTALSMHRNLIPPSLHFQRPNPEIPFASSPFAVVTEPALWPSGAVRRAAVSSFGLGGTNAHFILEEAPKALETTPVERPSVLRLSAKTAESLQAASLQLADWLSAHPETNLADVAWTLDAGRARFDHRAIVAASTPDEAARKLRAERVAGTPVSPRPKIAFMFPGQGSQHPGMGEALYRSEPSFREAFDRCAEILKGSLGVDLRSLLYPPEDQRAAAAEQLRNTQLAQPAIFTVSYACASYWLHLGLEPDAMIGHSVGEWVAATIAGVFDLPDALALLAERARLMQSMPSGGMMAVRLPEEGLRPLLGDDVDFAGLNAPSISVVAGPHAALDTLAQRLEAQGVGTTRLHTSHAFHSAMMDPAVAPFAAAISRVPRNAPQRRIVSTVTGEWASAEQLQDPNYWASQIRKTVRFAPAVATLTQQSGWVLLEAGPGQNLTTSSRQQLGSRGVAIATLPHPGAEGADAHLHAIEAQGRLWVAGVEFPAQHLYAGELRRKVGLPGYAFARTRHWIDATAATSVASSAPSRPIAEQSVAGPAVASSSAQTPEQRQKRALLEVLEESLGSPIAPAQFGETWLGMGMDSLLLTQVAGKIKSRFKVEVKFRELLEQHTTVDKLALHLAALGTAPVAVAPPPPAWGTPPEVSSKPNGADPAPSSVPAKAFGAQAKISKTESGSLSERQRAALEAFTARYTARTGKSKAYAQAHRRHLADPRTVSGFRPLLKELIYPIVTERSDGAYLWDLDGNRYIDITNGFGCIFFGHRPEFVTRAIEQQLRQGFEIGPQTPLAGQCAEAIARFTGLPRVAFCNTGSEAVLAAMRVARTVSGRNLILMHTSDYHGIQDEVIVRPAADGRALPAAPGIPRDSTANVVIKDYGDPATLRFVQEHADDLAAVLVEPVQSRNADLQPTRYLRELRDITSAAGIAFIMDEVITGFRAHRGGAQAYFGVKADVATYGKVIGGGMPVGVIAGIERYMDALDGGFWQYGDASVPEVGVTYFAGTFVRHPLTMAAVKAVCEYFERNPDPHTALNRRTRKMVEELNLYMKRVGAPVHLTNFTSLLRAQFTSEQPFGEMFFLFLREAGLHIFEGRPCFLTLAHSEEDVDQVIRGFRYATEQMFLGDFFVNPLMRADEALGIAAKDPYAPPTAGARIGRRPDGTPAWFVRNPGNPQLWIEQSQTATEIEA